MRLPFFVKGRMCRAGKSVRATRCRTDVFGNARRSRRVEENGVVLILVLWVVVILSTMTLTFAHQTKLAAKMAGFQSDSMQADLVAKAGLRQALILLREDLIKDHEDSIERDTIFRFDYKDRYPYDAGNEYWAYGGDFSKNLYVYVEFGGGTYRVDVRDESAKLPLNNPDIPMESYQRLLMALGWAEDEAELMAGAIIDWRDPDDDPTIVSERRSRDTSSEAHYYNPRQSERDIRQNGPNYLCKNGPFSAMEELLLVDGIDSVAYFGEDMNENGKLDENERDRDKSFPMDNGDRFLQKGLKDFVTVYSNRVNLNTAPFEVIYAILYPLLGDEAERTAHGIINYRNGFDRVPYTKDDQPMRTITNDDEDDIHFDKVTGVEQGLLDQLFAKVASIRSDVFNVTALGEYHDVQKGYYAIVTRRWIPEDELPLYGIDTEYVEDLEQVRLTVRVFEPLLNAETLMSQSVDRSSRRRLERQHRRMRRL